MRRKGERKVERQWPDWGESHPVHNAIASGNGWFAAWYSQACTPWQTIIRKAGFKEARLIEIDRGAEPTPAEIESLAALWRCPVEHVVASRLLAVNSGQ